MDSRWIFEELGIEGVEYDQLQVMDQPDSILILKVTLL